MFPLRAFSHALSLISWESDLFFLTKVFFLVYPCIYVWTHLNMCLHICVCILLVRCGEPCSKRLHSLNIICKIGSGNESKARSQLQGSLRRLRFSLRKLWGKKYFINVPLKIYSCLLLSVITFTHFVCRQRISFRPKRGISGLMQ